MLKYPDNNLSLNLPLYKLIDFFNIFIITYIIINLRRIFMRPEFKKQLLINQRDAISQISFKYSSYINWFNDTENIVKELFPDEPSYIQLLKKTKILNDEYSNEDLVIKCKESLNKSFKLLNIIIDSLPNESINTTYSNTSKKVFIVHGTNNEIKESVARFLDKLSLEPIILHEQPNKGRTIIEKLTDYTDVSFAIVLLTADDLGKEKSQEKLKYRARQNVILELGLFLSKLGKQNVCALYEDKVEIPSDFSGVLYIPLNSDWKSLLFKELKAVGFDIDANNIIY